MNRRKPWWHFDRYGFYLMLAALTLVGFGMTVCNMVAACKPAVRAFIAGWLP